jgi:large conductance mechanosensitive channel
LVGDFINALLSFVVVAAVVYFFIVIPANKLSSKNDKQKPTEKICPECLSSIPLLAKRCKFCASKIK